MKTEYIQTEFEEITPAIRRAWEIKSHAQGKRLIPLAKGEKPPQEDEAPAVPFPHAVNRADADELAQLCGIGDEIAAAIVAHREAYGPFMTATDLESIPGIGSKTSDKLWEYQ